MGFDNRQAYSARASEYAELFGSIASTHPNDRQLVGTWADSVTGPVIDAGCGPGQWTAYLAGRGATISGVDQVSEFIDYAREHYPGVSFEINDIEALNVEDGSVGGVLAWYSLIHHEPGTIYIPLTEFCRALRPDGELLLGFFVGPRVERFDHGIVAAYTWPVENMIGELDAAGFDVVETHTRTGSGYRPHSAIVARRR